MRRDARGLGLADLLVALAVFGSLLALGAGALGIAARRADAVHAARNLATRMRRLASLARLEGRHHGLAFPADALEGDEPLREVVDGDSDGLRRADIRRGIDPTGVAFGLAREGSSVRVGRPAWPRVRALPPATGWLPPDEPAVRFGRSRLVSFSPDGGATSGRVYVTDGREQLCAVIVAGTTSRVRVWCYDHRREIWSRR